MAASIRAGCLTKVGIFPIPFISMMWSRCRRVWPRLFGSSRPAIYWSVRSLDLVAVIDPKTLRVKWWRNGLWVREHDPDWLPDGMISVYNNQPRDRHSMGRSRLIGIDPATFQTKTLFDGRPVQVYSTIWGKHEILSDGSLLITLSQQRRVLHVTRDGRVMMELLNRFDERRNLLLFEAQFFALDFFDFDFKELNCASS